MPDEGAELEPQPHEPADPDDPYALGKEASLVDQVWIMTRIIGATLLILLGFALLVGLLFRLT